MRLFDNIKSIDIEGIEYEIRTDYRDILTILTAFEDKELTDNEKYSVLFDILFIEEPPLINETFEKAFLFIDNDVSGLIEYPYNKQPTNNKNHTETRLYSFNKDYNYIISAMNKYFGLSIRDKEYLHWWDFILAFMDLGDCQFNQMVDIRKRKNEGKLTKEEKTWYYKNRDLIDLEEIKSSKEDILASMNLGF